MSDLTIEEMLDVVAARQITCPVCGGTDNLAIAMAEFMGWDCRSNLDGTISYGSDSDYCSPPKAITDTMPTLLCCNATALHEDGQSHWWVIPSDAAKYDSDFNPHQGV